MLFSYIFEATTYGGALKFTSVENVTLQDLMFVTNKATTAGGAVYGLNLGSVIIDNVNFTRNIGNWFPKIKNLIF